MGHSTWHYLSYISSWDAINLGWIFLKLNCTYGWASLPTVSAQQKWILVGYYRSCVKRYDIHYWGISLSYSHSRNIICIGNLLYGPLEWKNDQNEDLEYIQNNTQQYQLIWSTLYRGWKTLNAYFFCAWWSVYASMTGSQERVNLLIRQPYLCIYHSRLRTRALSHELPSIA